jgi:hypothetical protein
VPFSITTLIQNFRKFLRKKEYMMREDDCEACCTVTGVVVLFCCAIIALVMSSMVINDNIKKLDWEETKCNGANDLHVQTNSITNKGTLTAFNAKYNKTVTLINPPIRWWRILDTKQADIKSWAAALSGIEFTCYLNKDQSEGISARYSGMAEWYFGLVFSIVILLLYLIGGCYLCCDRPRRPTLPW